MVIMADPWKHPRTGVYYIRRHLPTDVRAKFGLVEFKRTLGTKSSSDARRLFHAASAELDEAIALARSGFNLTSVNAKALAGEWLRGVVAEDEQERSADDREAMIDETARVSGYDLQYEQMEHAAAVGKTRQIRMRKAVTDEVTAILRAKGIPLAEGSEDHQRLAEEVFWAKVRLLSIQNRREQGDWTKPIGLDDYPRFFAPKSEAKRPLKRPAVETEGDLLSVVYAAYKEERKLPEKTEHEIDKGIRRFIEVHGDLVVTQVTSKSVREFKAILRRLPKRQPPSIRGKRTVPDVVALMENGAPYATLSDGAINKDIGSLSAVLSWANKQGYFDELFNWGNPTAGIKISKSMTSEEDRPPYDVEDLKAIFSMPIFTMGERPVGGAGEAARWLPLIALWSGARLNEIGQLLVSDIKQEKDVWYIDINTLDPEKKKRLKTRSSIRKVPLHKELIACGLLEYVEVRRQARDRQLFPQLKADKFGNVTAAWSKWWVTCSPKAGPFKAGKF